MTPEEKILWDEVVAIVRNATDRRYVCYTTVPHDVLLAADTDLATLTRERNEAIKRAEVAEREIDGWKAEVERLNLKAEAAERDLAESRAEATRLREALHKLLEGVRWWAAQEDGIPDEIWDAYVKARYCEDPTLNTAETATTEEKQDG